MGKRKRQNNENQNPKTVEPPKKKRKLPAFRQREVVPFLRGMDELNFQKVFRKQNGYRTPSKLIREQANNFASPHYFSSTPRHREFKKIVSVFASRAERSSRFDLYQEVSDSSDEEGMSPPVIRKTGDQVERVLFSPISDRKVVAETFVTDDIIEEGRYYKRKPTKQSFANVSANELHNFYKDDEKDQRFVYSHLYAVGQGGEDGPENMALTLESHNKNRMKLVEGPATKVILNKKLGYPGLFYSAEISLELDKDDNPTHIGKAELSTWKSPRKTSRIEIRLDAQNSEVSNKVMSGMMKHIFFEIFPGVSSPTSSQYSTDSSEEGSDEGDSLEDSFSAGL